MKRVHVQKLRSSSRADRERAQIEHAQDYLDEKALSPGTLRRAVEWARCRVAGGRLPFKSAVLKAAEHFDVSPKAIAPELILALKSWLDDAQSERVAERIRKTRKIA